MIQEVSEKVSRWLVNQGVVDDKEKALFSYAVFSLLFGISPILISLLLGAVLRMMHESILMILPYMLIRKFCGGFHMKSPKTCFSTSSSLILLSLLSIRYIVYCNASCAVVVLVTLATVSIWTLSPIDSEERRLSPEEKRAFRIVAIIFSTAFALVSMFSTLCGDLVLGASIGHGVIIPAVLQIPCIFAKGQFRKS